MIEFYDENDNVIHTAKEKKRDFLFYNEKYCIDTETSKRTNNPDYDSAEMVQVRLNESNIEPIKNRKIGYGTVEDQLSLMQSQGFDSWKTMRDSVDSKHALKV